MTPNEKIIHFNRLKAQKIKDLGCDIPYMLESDYDTIRAWAIDDAENVWKTIKAFVLKCGSYGMNSDNCCFCIMHDSYCAHCEYGKTHGMCASQKPDNNDYGKIVTSIMHKRELLSSYFYKTAIFKIENGV